MLQSPLLEYSAVDTGKAAEFELSRQLYLAGDGKRMNPAAWHEIEILSRRAAANDFQDYAAKPFDGLHIRQAMAEQQEEIESTLAERSKRRQVELILADKLETAAPYCTNPYHAYKHVDRMRSCRQCGTVGHKPGGGHVVAWDSKCGNSRLCPDESREEQKRLEKRYLPAAMAWRMQNALTRIHFGVLTKPNVPAGQLIEGKRQLFEDFKAWQKLLGEFCDIQGAIVVQEDPLAADGDWNIHLNVMLFIKGEFSYKRARMAWGHNLELSEIKSRQPQDLSAGFREVIKYSAAHVGEKSDHHAAAGKSCAPPMTEWPPERLAEWYDGQQRFRRTRTYGCMYKVKKPEADFHMDEIQWQGTIKFTSAGSYWVDLIPEDNFLNSDAYGGDNIDSLTTDDHHGPP